MAKELRVEKESQKITQVHTAFVDIEQTSSTNIQHFRSQFSHSYVEDAGGEYFFLSVRFMDENHKVWKYYVNNEIGVHHLQSFGIEANQISIPKIFEYEITQNGKRLTVRVLEELLFEWDGEDDEVVTEEWILNCSMAPTPSVESGAGMFHPPARNVARQGEGPTDYIATDFFEVGIPTSAEISLVSTRVQENVEIPCSGTWYICCAGNFVPASQWKW